MTNINNRDEILIFKDDINWGKLSAQALPEIFIKEYANYLDLNMLFRSTYTNPRLLDEIGIEAITPTTWKHISKQKLDIEFMIKYCNKLDWETICCKLAYTKDIEPEVIRDLISQVCFCFTGQDWKCVCEKIQLSEEFLRTHSNKLSWKTVSEHQALSSKFIDDYADKLDWKIMSQYQLLTEEQLRRHKHKLNWTKVCLYQRLSEKFILDHQSFVRWKCIYENQTLSERFISTHLDENPEIFNWHKDCECEEYDEEYEEDHWGVLTRYQKLSEDFLLKYADKWINNSDYFETIIRCQDITQQFMYKIRERVITDRNNQALNSKCDADKSYLHSKEKWDEYLKLFLEKKSNKSQ